MSARGERAHLPLLRTIPRTFRGKGCAPTVLESVRVDQAKVNPYIPLLFQSLEPHLVVISFSWKRALLGRYDIIHVHWPEGLYVGRSRLEDLLKKLFSVLMFMRIFVFRTRVVQTLYNLSPR